MERMRGRRGKIFLIGLLVAAVSPGAAMAQTPNGSPGDEAPSFETPTEAEAVPGRIIVKFEEDATSAEEADARRDEGLEEVETLDLVDAEVAEVEGQPVEQAVRDLERRPDVEYAEPDHILSPFGYADEPRFGELWGLNNTGQSIEGSPGSPDFDTNALEASGVTQGDPNLVVAVIDDGVDFTHPDLASRKWVNPGESGGGKETNRRDDDRNGYVDDVNGWDFANNDNTVHDSRLDSHGTHVAGTIAASVNGGGVVGVAPNVKIMALNFLGTGPNSGSVSSAIRAIQYAKSKGVRISNNSWGGTVYNQALKDAIDASGQLFVAAAGNGGADQIGDDNDGAAPAYPASYTSPNILSVAAVENTGGMASFSNYGATSVDISAPGVSILSTIPGLPTSTTTAPRWPRRTWPVPPPWSRRRTRRSSRTRSGSSRRS
ncbi:S8 family serine peptidase [Rubrobacter marinus]|uniref:S8 family serine peptidase n=1 Tax=Rubrobacter marinus TaxID=2653852 RepID=A0A6G8Q133_9ACTN|nr:S8 family serine peptidase [Rubrobacter marinus]